MKDGKIALHIDQIMGGETVEEGSSTCRAGLEEAGAQLEV